MPTADEDHRARMNEEAHRRRVRSFVRREGRLTSAQRRALEELWPRYGIDVGPGGLDLDAAFGRRAPRVLEIGFGGGEALAAAAERHPENDYLGVEVYRPGIGRLLLELEARGIDNVRVCLADAVELLGAAVPPASLDAIHVFFPDPWPKKRHHKRRLIQPGFAALLARALRPGGTLRLATDWPDYARHMLEVLEATDALENLEGPGRCAPRPAERPVTRFEARGEARGHPVWDLAYRRRA
ncbi:MAG: tRNA (guanosine(46)-N7)-methyltransferase TrmB [Gammaproteobacteria bacterium]|nr:tRNA (guanosine(46)-N7)-methyltransferase TrmB [Gammaproteobacteria bacterium]